MGLVVAPGAVVGGYRVVGLLGRGGMAVVYEAEHESSPRRVALKLLGGDLASDPAFVERFRREGRLQASLEHPHVVTVYEAGESEQGLYLAMLLVRGPTLAALLIDGVLGGERALGMLHQIATALDAAHDAGLVHRDVKPKNVLVGQGDHAYLADFGLTRVGGSTGVTVTGQLVGTLAYLAPEVIRGQPATPASDRYAFAAMLFECLSGGVVFPRTSAAAMLFAHTSESPPRISRRRDELPEALDEVLSRALAKDPADRPDSAVAIVDSVTRALDGSAVAALGPPHPPEAVRAAATTLGPLGSGEPVPPRRRRRRAAVLLGVGLLAAGAVATGVAALAGDDAASSSGVPPPVAGAQVLGSDLASAGDTRDCHGRQVRPGSRSCTIVQTELPGATLVVPEDGVVRGWGVRAASGELALTVIRPRGGGYLPIARTRNEFVTDDGVHRFDADLAVDRGDLLGVDVQRGSGIGALPAASGAATSRWLDLLGSRREPDLAAGTGFDDELLLRVEYVPGERQRLPAQVTGAKAAALAPGQVRERSRVRFTNGRLADVALVERSGRFALDSFSRGRRVASIEVPPDFRPQSGRLLTFNVYPERTEPEDIYVELEYVNEGSARILKHFYIVHARSFEFVS